MVHPLTVKKKKKKEDLGGGDGSRDPRFLGLAIQISKTIELLAGTPSLQQGLCRSHHRVSGVCNSLVPLCPLFSLQALTWLGEGSFGLWLLYWFLDSQPFEGSRGAPALTITRGSWDAGKCVSQAPTASMELSQALSLGLRGR